MMFWWHPTTCLSVVDWWFLGTRSWDISSSRKMVENTREIAISIGKMMFWSGDLFLFSMDKPMKWPVDITSPEIELSSFCRWLLTHQSKCVAWFVDLPSMFFVCFFQHSMAISGIPLSAWFGHVFGHQKCVVCFLSLHLASLFGVCLVARGI